MKKSILTLVGALLLLAGVFMSSRNTYAGAKPGQCTQFSTGPLENVNGINTTSQVVFIKMLNNNPKKTIEASATVFALDETKTQVRTITGVIAPLSDEFFVVEVEGVVEFEVNGTVSGAPKGDMLVSVFGKDVAGNLVPAHRVLHSKLVKADCENMKGFRFDNNDLDMNF